MLHILCNLLFFHSTVSFADLFMSIWALVVHELFFFFSLMPPSSASDYAKKHLSFLLRRTFAEFAGFAFWKHMAWDMVVWDS